MASWADPMLTRLRSLGPDAGASAAASPPSDRLAALLEAQQRRPELPVSARDGDRAWLKEWTDAPRPAPLKPYVVAHPYTLLQGKVLPAVLVALLANRAERDRSGPSIVGGNNQGGAVTAAGQVLVDVSRSILERNKAIEPTITVAKGTQVLVEVARDIEFPGAFRRQ